MHSTSVTEVPSSILPQLSTKSSPPNETQLEDFFAIPYSNVIIKRLKTHKITVIERMNAKFFKLTYSNENHGNF